jgi:predicted PolB exonuclease-like 3'-5' exonuclease
MLLRESSSSQSFGITPSVSQIKLNYELMENQVKAILDLPMVEQEEHRVTQESLGAYHAHMQAFMAVRIKNTFVAFITFSDMSMC